MRPLMIPALLLAATLGAACAEPRATDPQQVQNALSERLLTDARAAGMVRVEFPANDPGAPLYARVEPSLKQSFHDGEWLAIPFVRRPEQVPDEFNLLQYFDPPGAAGPGAFAAELVLSGYFMIEAGAPLGTFPKVAISTGSAVPIWFVRWTDFQQAMADGVVTMPELRALQPVEGVATRYLETLRPRMDEHLVVINASGTVSDGRQFDLHVTHEVDRTRSIRIQFGR